MNSSLSLSLSPRASLSSALTFASLLSPSISSSEPPLVRRFTPEFAPTPFLPARDLGLDCDLGFVSFLSVSAGLSSMSMTSNGTGGGGGGGGF